MSSPRSEASAIEHDGLIYVVGGFTGCGTTSVESYNPNADEWTERMALDVGGKRLPLVSFNGMLYVFLAGRQVREYDPVNDVWTKVSK